MLEADIINLATKWATPYERGERVAPCLRNRYIARVVRTPALT
jgi:hypothetical protein